MSNSMHKQSAETQHSLRSSTLTTTQVRLPAVAATMCDITKGDPFMNCDRNHLVSVLDGQIEACIRDNYRLSLVLIQLDKNPLFNEISCDTTSKFNSVFYASLINILRRSFRPIDIALLYQGDTIALILPDGSLPINVIREDVRRQLAALGSLSGFGMSAVIGRSGQYLDAGELLLSTAESRLKVSCAQESSKLTDFSVD